MPKSVRLNLTDRYVQRLSCPPGKTKHLFPDQSGNGLVLQVMASGDKRWKFRYSHAGRRNLLEDIGPAHLVLHEEAKAKAAELQRHVTVLRFSPKTLRYQPKASATFDDVLDHHVSTLSEGSRRNLKTKLKPLRDAFGAEPVADVTRARLKDFIDQHWAASPGSARLVVRNLSAAFNKALDPDSPVALPANFINPASKLAKALVCLRDHAPKSRAVAFEPEEFKAIFAALEDGYGDPALGDIGIACLELILVTGARPLEIQSLRWDEIEPVPDAADLRYIVKERHKTWKRTGRPRQITVGPTGVKVLARAEKWRRADCPYVFPGRRVQKNTKDPYFTSDTELAVKLSDKAKIRIRPGSFRSAYINFMLSSLEGEQSFNSLYDALELVAENVGHTDVRITLEHYTKGKHTKRHEAVRLTDAGLAALRVL